MKIKIEGLDKIKKQLEYIKSPQGIEELLTNRICKLVPEAESVKDKFKFSHEGTKVRLEIGGLSKELHDKITKALNQ